MGEKNYSRIRSDSALSVETNEHRGLDGTKKTSYWTHGIRIIIALCIPLVIYSSMHGCSHLKSPATNIENDYYNIDATASSPLPMEISRVMGGAYKTHANDIVEAEGYIILPTKTAEYEGGLGIRADKKTTDKPKSSETTDAPKPTKFYNQAGVRFVFVLAAFVILNMVAIVIHHIYQKLSGSQRRYRNVDQNISPF